MIDNMPLGTRRTFLIGWHEDQSPGLVAETGLAGALMASMHSFTRSCILFGWLLHKDCGRFSPFQALAHAISQPCIVMQMQLAIDEEGRVSQVKIF